MWEGAGLEGQVLIAVGFFSLQLEAFVSPRNAWFFFSYCFALFVSWMFWPAAKVMNCGALSYNLTHHERRWKVWGSSCGNMKLQTSVQQIWHSWCRTWMDEYQHQGRSLQKPLATAWERSAAAGIQRAAFHFCLQQHVGETCAIALLFMPPSDLPKVNYRKLPVNPKMQWISIRSSSSTLKINPGVWGDEGTSLVPPQPFREQISVSTRVKPSPFPPAQRGDPEDQL